jgi:hypothetical protein
MVIRIRRTVNTTHARPLASIASALLIEARMHVPQHRVGLAHGLKAGELRGEPLMQAKTVDVVADGFR